jgi:two-component system response regulator CpxR
MVRPPGLAAAPGRPSVAAIRRLSEAVRANITAAEDLAMANRVLIVDDDVELCALLTEFLTGELYEVASHHSGNHAVERALEGGFSLIVLDVMLPGVSGFEILRQIRRRSDLPVILLTARGEDVDRIVGLELGADDYLAKPFNPRELGARIHAVLRRLQPRRTGDDVRVTTIGDLTLDRGARTVIKDGQPVQLTTVEFDLLSLLLLSAGKVVSREAIAESVLGRKFDGVDRSIDMHISRLRRKLEGPGDLERIKTVRGSGYIYVHPQEGA